MAHPGSKSLCAGLSAATQGALDANGLQLTVHDLYADGFDPRMPLSEVGTSFMADPLVERYAAEVLAADAFVIVHPVWFFHVPAILKGWVDRVLREGVVYELGRGGEAVGLLRAKRALVVNTANAPAEVEASVYGEPLDTFWRQVVFGPAGVTDVRRLRFSKVAGSSQAEREAWLSEVEGAVADLVDGL